MKTQVINPTAKTIVIYSDKKYEQFAENTIQSFFVVKERFQFLYFTIDFNSDWELENVHTIRVDSIPGIPHIQLMKPMIIKNALQLIERFIYVDVDLMASRHFDYDGYISQVKEFPYSPVLHETAWQRPIYFCHKDGVRQELDETCMMQLLGVKERTQSWVTTLIMGVDQSCLWFVYEWVNICKDKELWDGSEELRSRGSELDPFRLYFHMGDETPYNVMLWKYKVKDYHADNIVIEPRQLETVRRIENEHIQNERLEQDNPITDCKDSDRIMVYHQLKEMEFRKQVLALKEDRKKYKVIINLPNCELPQYQKQKQEAYSTWIPWAEQKGALVICSVAYPELEKEYELHDKELWCKCEDTLDVNFLKKRFYFFKWATETQSFDYLYVTSMDTFVHVDRFMDLLDEYKLNPEIKYAGAVVPYMGWNPFDDFRIMFKAEDFVDKQFLFISGGSGYIMTKESALCIVKNTDLETILKETIADDVVFADAIKKDKISIFHDNRIMSSSPFNVYWEDPGKLGLPYIKDANSFLIVQHPLETHFKELIEVFQPAPRKKEPKFLVVCSFYNNTLEHIQQTFDNLEQQTYKNWMLVVADDFSTNDCKAILATEFYKRGLCNSLLYEPKFKREIYLYQNLFKGLQYDYYLDLDADDIISPKLLELYAYHFKKYPEVNSIYSDFVCVNEQSALQRISAIRTGDPLEAIDVRTNQDTDTVTARFHSWSMFGHGRCFRKRKDNAFPIAYLGRTATDSFTLFTCLCEGNHLQLPRNLYTWKLRERSDSTAMTVEEHAHYNDNTNSAIRRYRESGKGKQLELYSDVWMETTALSYAKFTETETQIDVIAEIEEMEKNKLRDLYYDKGLSFNCYCKAPTVVVWNKISDVEKVRVFHHLTSNPTIKFCIYLFYDHFDIDKEEINEAIKAYQQKEIAYISKHLPFQYFSYYRHLILSNI